mgnify:CR=1 FL=1
MIPLIQNTLRVGNSVDEQETPFYAGFKVKIFDSNFHGEEGALIVQCWGKQVANGNVWGIVAMHPCLTVRVHATLTSNVSRQSHKMEHKPGTVHERLGLPPENISNNS